MRICKKCGVNIEDKRAGAKFCSDRCTKAFNRNISDIKSDNNSDNVQDNKSDKVISDKPEQINSVPTSKGGKWVPTHPYVENPGMCKYCGKMTYLTDNETIDVMVECCHNCARLKNE